MRRKTWILAVITAGLVMSFADAAFAEQWQIGRYGYWYDLGNGSYAVGWKQVNGRWYYFNQDGYMQTGWQSIDGVWYYLEGSGEMVTGWKALDGNWYYFDGNGAMATGWRQVNGNWYYLEGNGMMYKDGWKSLDNNRYFFKPDGSMAKGSFSDGSYQYMTDDSGAVYRNMILQGKVKFDENGCMMTRSREGQWEYAPDMDEMIARKKEQLADDLWERRYKSAAEFEADVKETLSGYISNWEIQELIVDAEQQFEYDFDMNYDQYIRRYGRK